MSDSSTAKDAGLLHVLGVPWPAPLFMTSDGVVHALDLNRIQQALGKSFPNPGYLAYFDYDGNGTVDRCVITSSSSNVMASTFDRWEAAHLQAKNRPPLSRQEPNERERSQDPRGQSAGPRRRNRVADIRTGLS